MSEQFETDAELFSLVKLGDKKAFNLLYERYWSLIYKKAFSYLCDPNACTEIVNDIFLNIWVKRDVLNIITFKDYLTAAVRYRVYNCIKAGKRAELTYVENYEKLAYIDTDNNDGEKNLSTTDVQYHVDRLLNNLPKRCREIFLLSRVTQLTNSEIAFKLSISKRTVENQISVAVKYLKGHFNHFIALLVALGLLFRR